MPKVKVGRVNLVYDDVGAGPAIVFVHGHPFNRTMWSPQREAVAEAGWRMLCADLRGYGESTVFPGTTYLETFADDVAVLLNKLSIPNAVIVGLSMGGQITMAFAERYPDRVRGLVLAATFPQAEDKNGKARRYAIAEEIERGGMDAYADELLPGMLAKQTFAALPDVVAHVDGMMRRTNPRGAAAALRGRAERRGYENILANLEVPALIVVGEEDGFTTMADGRHMQELMPHAKLLAIPGVGHMPNLEARDLFNAELVAFLDLIRAAW